MEGIFKRDSSKGGGGSSVRTIEKEGAEVGIDILGNTDIVCKDKITSLTINGNGGLQKIDLQDYSSQTRVDFGGGKYIVSKSGTNKYSSDLGNWNNIDVSDGGIVAGDNIVIINNKVFNLQDMTQSKDSSLAINKTNDFCVKIKKDGYIYILKHHNDDKIYKVKDDFDLFSVQEISLDGKSIKGVSYNNSWVVAFDDGIYSGDIETNSLTKIKEDTDIYSVLIKDNFICYFKTNNNKLIYTTDNFSTSNEVSFSGKFFRYGRVLSYMPAIVGDRIVYSTINDNYNDVNTYYRDINNIETENQITGLEAYDNEFIDMGFNNETFLFGSDFAYSYITPKPLPTTETNIYFTTDSETPTLVDNANLKWLNSNSIEADNEYVLSIKRGYAVIGKKVEQ